MTTYNVPVVIRQERETVLIVRVDAGDERAADKLAERVAQHILDTDLDGVLAKLQSWHCEWSTENAGTCGIDPDRQYRSEAYGSDIDAVEDPSLLPPEPEDPRQVKMFDGGSR